MLVQNVRGPGVLAALGRAAGAGAVGAVAQRLLLQVGLDLPLLPVVVDVDGFTPVNDEHDHTAGDALVVQVGR